MAPPPNPSTQRTPGRRPWGRILVRSIAGVLLVCAGVWGWWLLPQAFERQLPASASANARTTAALCDRGAPGWCHGLGMMYACEQEGLRDSRERSDAADAADCARTNCDEARVLLIWDDLVPSERDMACQAAAWDTEQAVAALPRLLQRRPGR